MEHLSRSETKLILESLQCHRDKWREEIIETFGALPDRETSPGYYKLVDLQAKLTRHLENLPY